jgi:hypothetical protein
LTGGSGPVPVLNGSVVSQAEILIIHFDNLELE